jgi:hypothetical protein
MEDWKVGESLRGSGEDDTVLDILGVGLKFAKGVDRSGQLTVL